MVSVTAHKDYGLNATLPVCFWCRETSSVVALLGDSYAGPAPATCVMSYEPCAACKEAFSRPDVMLCMEVAPPSDGHPALGHNVPFAPTGRYVVLNRDIDLFKNMGEAQRHSAFLAGRVMIDVEAFEAVFAPLMAAAERRGVPDARQAHELRAEARRSEALRLSQDNDGDADCEPVVDPETEGP